MLYLSFKGIEIIFIFHQHLTLIMSLAVLPSVTAGPSLLCRRALVSSGLESYLKLAKKSMISLSCVII